MSFISIFKTSFLELFLNSLNLPPHKAHALPSFLGTIKSWVHENISFVSLSNWTDITLLWSQFDPIIKTLMQNLFCSCHDSLFCVLWLMCRVEQFCPWCCRVLVFLLKSSLGVKPWLWHFVLLTCLLYW